VLLSFHSLNGSTYPPLKLVKSPVIECKGRKTTLDALVVGDEVLIGQVVLELPPRREGPRSTASVRVGMRGASGSVPTPDNNLLGIHLFSFLW
jgi:hypothetical protein